MYLNTFKLLSVNIFIFAIFIVSYFYGYTSSFFKDDITHISYILAFLMVINAVLRIWQEYQFDTNFLWNRKNSVIERYLEFIIGKFFYIGLIGTLLGFSHMIKSIQDLTDVEKVLKVMSEGALTLFNTTIIGIIAYLWSSLNTFLARGE